MRRHGGKLQAILISAALLSALAGLRTDAQPKLSPADWPEDEREKYEELQTKGWGAWHGESRDAMIVSTGGPLAIHAGVRTLEQGGTAADAAIATALAQIALSAGSVNCYAGIFNMLYYDASSREVHGLYGGFNTVLAEDDPMTIPKRGTPSGRSTLVPGFMAAAEAAHKRFGRLPWAALFEPAIYLAEEGFVVGEGLAGSIQSRKNVLMRLEETKAVFTKPDGTLYAAGDTFRQPELAKTLKAVARDGARYMYTGEWAERFVEAVRAEGGKIAMRDLERYRVKWEDAVSVRYHDHDVFAIGPPEGGGTQTLEALNIIEASDFKPRGHYTKSAEAMYWFMQICRFGHVPGKARPFDDPKNPEDPFNPSNRLREEAGEENWARIQEKGWEVEFKKSFEPVGHSDTMIVVDNDGNIAVLVHSINALVWGSTGIFVDGVSVPDAACHQQDRVALVGPGNRVPLPTNPLIVFRDRKPVLATSCIGSSLPEWGLQNLTNILDFGLTPKETVQVPKFGGPWRFSEPDEEDEYHKCCVIPGYFPDELLDGVRELGQEIKILEPGERVFCTSAWVGIQFDQETGKLRGARSHGISGLVEGF